MSKSQIELIEGIATTRAIRRFKSDPIPEKDLSTIMFAATRAASGSNRQAFRFLVLRDGPKAREAKQVLKEAFTIGWGAYRGDRAAQPPNSPAGRLARTMEKFVGEFDRIPVIVLACLVRYRDANPFEGASIYPACQNLLLAARALGYGGVITMWHLFKEAELRQMLGIPEKVALSACIPLGKPEGRHGPVRRRPLRELVYDDEWEGVASWATDPPGTRFSVGLP